MIFKINCKEATLRQLPDGSCEIEYVKLQDEVDGEFAKEQQIQVDRFKKLMLTACEEVMSTFYCDVLSKHGVTDAQINFKNALWDEVREDFKKEITSEYTHYSRAHSLRMDLLKNHKEELRNKIIEDLTEKNIDLSRRLHESYQRYK